MASDEYNHTSLSVCSFNGNPATNRIDDILLISKIAKSMPKIGFESCGNNSLINPIIFKTSSMFLYGRKRIDVSILYRM
jgi:hypothetical protein